MHFEFIFQPKPLTFSLNTREPPFLTKQPYFDLRLALNYNEQKALFLTYSNSHIQPKNQPSYLIVYFTKKKNTLSPLFFARTSIQKQGRVAAPTPLPATTHHLLAQPPATTTVPMSSPTSCHPTTALHLTRTAPYHNSPEFNIY